MKIIKDIICFLKDEIEGVEEYTEMAQDLRAEHREISDMFIKLAEAESSHIDTLHKILEKLIEISREKNGEPPKEMQIIWDYEHKNIMEETLEERTKLEIVKRT